MIDQPPPDGCEKCIRFGCGALFGGALVFFGLARYFFSTGRPFWIAVGAGILICGLLSVRYGDQFYRWILDFFSS